MFARDRARRGKGDERKIRKRQRHALRTTRASGISILIESAWVSAVFFLLPAQRNACVCVCIEIGRAHV